MIMMLVSAALLISHYAMAVTCGSQLADDKDFDRRLTNQVRQLATPIQGTWAISFAGYTHSPLVVLVGVESRAKTEAVQDLLARVRPAKVFDLYARSSAGLNAGLAEFNTSWWNSKLQGPILHVMDITLPAAPARIWRHPGAARDELERLGFERSTIMMMSSLYLIDP